MMKVPGLRSFNMSMAVKRNRREGRKGRLLSLSPQNYIKLLNSNFSPRKMPLFLLLGQKVAQQVMDLEEIM